MVALLAIGSAFFMALQSVVFRVGLKYSNPLSAFLIVQIACLVASLGICVFAVPLNQFANRAVLYFIAAGAMGPYIARFLLLEGIDRVGSAISSSLSQTKPLFSAIAAVMILGESVTVSIALGMILIVFGVATIGSEESGGQIEKEWSKKDLIFPFLAAASFGLTHVFRKMGLNVAPEPIVGVTVQNATAFVLFPVLALAQRNQQRMVLNDKRAWFVFGLSGFLNFAAQLCMFCALNLGQVLIVTPLSALSPFFVLVFVGIFLRRLERVTWKIVLGSVSIVGGTVVLTLISQG